MPISKDLKIVKNENENNNNIPNANNNNFSQVANSVDFISEKVIQLKPVNEDLLNQYNMKLIIPNLSHLESYDELSKEFVPRTLYLLMANGRKFDDHGELTHCCFALQSSEDQKIQCLISVEFKTFQMIPLVPAAYKLFDTVPEFREIVQNNISSKAFIQDLVGSKLQTAIHYQILLILEVLSQLKKLNVQKVALDESPEKRLFKTNNQLSLWQLFLFKTQIDHASGRPTLEFDYDNEQINQINIINNSLIGKNSLPKPYLIKSDTEYVNIKDIPLPTLKFSEKSAFPTLIPPVASTFKYLPEYGLRLFIPQPDQLLPIAQLYIDCRIAFHYVASILNNFAVENSKEKYFVYGLQDIVSEKILGVIYFKINSQIAYIDSLQIISEYQEKGFGSLLLCAAIEQIKKFNCKSVFVDSSSNALRTYCNYGFEPNYNEIRDTTFETSDEEDDNELRNTASLTSDEDEVQEYEPITQSKWRQITLIKKVVLCKNNHITDLTLNLKDPINLKLLDDRLQTLQDKLSQRPASENGTSSMSDNSLLVSLSSSTKENNIKEVIANILNKYRSNFNITELLSELLFSVLNLDRFDIAELILKSNVEISVNTTYVDKNHRDYGITSLWLACVKQKWDLVKIMLDPRFNPDVNAAPKNPEHLGYKTNVLLLSLDYGQYDLVKQMLALPITADVNAAVGNEKNRRGYGITSLWLACDKQKWDLVKIMLDPRFNPDVNAAPKNPEHLKYKINVLLLSLDYGQYDLVKQMLALPITADVNAAVGNEKNRRGYGITSLWLACDKQKWDLVKIMLDPRFNPDVNAAPKNPEHLGYKINVLWLSLDYGQYDLAEIMLKLPTTADVNAAVGNEKNRGYGITSLWLACGKQKWDLVKIMLDHFIVNVNAAPKNPEHPEYKINVLWLSLDYGQYDLAEIMLKLPTTADVNAALGNEKNRGYGITSLWLACGKQKWDLVKIMLDPRFNPDVNAAPKNPEHLCYKINVLWLSLHYEQYDLAEIMLKLPTTADVNAAVGNEKDRNYGISSLWLACGKQKWDLVKIMLNPRFNPDVNAAPKNLKHRYFEQNVLFIFANNKQWGFFRTCLNLKQDINFHSTANNKESGDYQKTILGFAIADKQWDIVITLYLKDIKSYSEKDKLTENDREDYTAKINEFNKIRRLNKKILFWHRNTSLSQPSLINLPKDIKKLIALEIFHAHGYTNINDNLLMPLINTDSMTIKRNNQELENEGDENEYVKRKKTDSSEMSLSR